MSVRAMDWAFDSGLEPGARFVLVVLADHAGDHSGENWACYPSVERICARTGYSRASVERHLKALEKGGWIRRARRKMPGGRLGIYDYELVRSRHHDGVFPKVEGGSPHVNLQHGPGVNLQHGPGVILDEAMRQNEGQPCINLQHEEPSLEPSEEPSGAREPGDDGFDEAFDAYPDAGRRKSSPPRARAAWALWSGRIGAGELMAAIRRFAAEDPDVKRGVCRAFETFLSGEFFRHWLGGTVEASAAEPHPSRTGFAGPAEVRAEVVAARGGGPNGELFAVSYLDRAAWDPEAKTLRAATGTGFDRLREVSRVFAKHGVRLLAPGQRP